MNRTWTVILLAGVLLYGCAAQSDPPAPPIDDATLSALPTRTELPAATVTALPPPSPQPLPTQPVIVPTPDPTRPSQPEQSLVRHVVQRGETLGLIAQTYGTTVDTLLQLNPMSDPDAVLAGQTLLVPAGELRLGPSDKLIPDSELVYGPAFSHFQVDALAQRLGGYLIAYVEEVEGQNLTGPEIVQLVAQRFSVGPRLLLALLELKSGWVTNSSPSQETLDYPMGEAKDGWDGLFIQLSWAANQLNRGYYGWQSNWLTNAEFPDGTALQLAASLNAGTVAVQVFLARHNSVPVWENQVRWDGSLATIYRAFFGDPFRYAIEPLIPDDLSQPPMVLPWAEGETWYFTGGPHGGWGTHSGWAALDFVPAGDQLGCYTTDAWVRSISTGRVLRSENGEVVVDLDDDGFEGTGWTVLYMHIERRDRVPVGTWLEPGDRIGHPSCEGGFSNGTHVHVARRYNGRWIEADGAVPFVLDGWVTVGFWSEYDGALENGDEVREACECRELETNGITR